MLLAAGRFIRSAVVTLTPRRLRRWLAQGRLAALLILAVVLGIRALDPPPVQLLFMRSFDLLQELFPRAAEEQPVVIVDIDDESLAAIGQWPWPRTIIAALVDRLSELGAAVIGFDVLFAEPDRTSPAKIAALYPNLDAPTREGLARLPSNDDVLAASLRRSQRVVLAATGKEREIAGAAPAAVKAPVARLGGDPDRYLRRFPGVIRAIPQLDEAAAGQGMITIDPELDNVVRRVPLILNVQGQLFPALAFDMLRVLTGQSVAVRSDAAGVADLLVAESSM